MSFGPAPWRQTNWDWRAAGNFVCGGAGAGLIVFAALFGAATPTFTALVLTGLALVGLGLFCVWLEIGRPLRALHVFFNPRTSWMTREACAATLLFPAGLAAAAGLPGCAWVAAALALAFVYCQGRMLEDAKGIPAWRDPLLTPLIVITGLVEGTGLSFVIAPPDGGGIPPVLVLFGVLLLARILVWLAYRRRLGATVAPKAQAALDRAGRWLQLAGTLAPLVLTAAIMASAAAAEQTPLLAAIAGLIAAAAGAFTKYTIVTRAAFNQGFALAHLPVRGAPP